MTSSPPTSSSVTSASMSSRQALRRSAPFFSAMTRRRASPASVTERARRKARVASSSVSPSAARTKASRGQRVSSRSVSSSASSSFASGRGSVRTRASRSSSGGSVAAGVMSTSGKSRFVAARSRSARTTLASESHGCTSSMMRATPVSPTRLAASMAARALGTVASSLQPRVAVHSTRRAPRSACPTSPTARRSSWVTTHTMGTPASAAARSSPTKEALIAASLSPRPSRAALPRSSSGPASFLMAASRSVIRPSFAPAWDLLRAGLWRR
jgi:hypothetical protein